MFKKFSRLSHAFLVAMPLSGSLVKEAQASNNTCQLPQSVGGASWYNQESSSTQTATGAYFNDRAMTAAHRWLKFGSRVRVTDLRTGRSIRVEINDNGPYIAGRIIDLSEGAADALKMRGRGHTKVKLEVLACP